ncbi:MAG: hypothetical protein ACK559_17210, partial [bacterium]
MPPGVRSVALVGVADVEGPHAERLRAQRDHGIPCPRGGRGKDGHTECGERDHKADHAPMLAAAMRTNAQLGFTMSTRISM